MERREFSNKNKQFNLEAGEAIRSCPLAEVDPLWTAVQSTTVSAGILERHTITVPLCVSLDLLECFWLQVTTLSGNSGLDEQEVTFLHQQDCWY